MIQTRKRPPAPAKLVVKQKAWTDRFKGGSPKWATNLAIKILRDALEPLAAGKCAFCESVLGATSYLQVEHYQPKRPHPELAFEWTNLFPACQICNTEKSDDNHQGSLLKPDEDDPEEYLDVDPDTGKVLPAGGLTAAHEHRVIRTIEILKLNRPQLQTQRKRMIHRISFWLKDAEKEPKGPDYNEWEKISHPETEFKLVIRTHLFRLGYPDLAKADRDRFHA